MPKKAKSCEVKEITAIDIDRYEGITKILNVLGNKTRVAILHAMTKHKEVCACELQPALNIPQPTVTTHLRKMYDVGLLKHRDVWKYTYYYVNPDYEQLVNDLLKCHANTILPSLPPYSKNKAIR